MIFKIFSRFLSFVSGEYRKKQLIIDFSNSVLLHFLVKGSMNVAMLCDDLFHRKYVLFIELEKPFQQDLLLSFQSYIKRKILQSKVIDLDANSLSVYIVLKDDINKGAPVRSANIARELALLRSQTQISQAGYTRNEESAETDPKMMIKIKLNELAARREFRGHLAPGDSVFSTLEELKISID